MQQFQDAIEKCLTGSIPICLVSIVSDYCVLQVEYSHSWGYHGVEHLTYNKNYRKWSTAPHYHPPHNPSEFMYNPSEFMYNPSEFMYSDSFDPSDFYSCFQFLNIERAKANPELTKLLINTLLPRNVTTIFTSDHDNDEWGHTHLPCGTYKDIFLLIDDSRDKFFILDNEQIPLSKDCDYVGQTLTYIPSKRIIYIRHLMFP